MLMCDHTYCYTPAVQHIAALIAEGELGDILFVDSVRINLGLVQPDVNVLWDLAPHDLSILDFVLPEERRPRRWRRVGADPIGAGQACVGHLTLDLGAGSMAHVHVNWLSPTKIRTMIIGGSRRTLVWDDLNPAQRIAVYDRSVGLDISADRRAPPAQPGFLPHRRHGGAGASRARGPWRGHPRVRRRHPRRAVRPSPTAPPACACCRPSRRRTRAWSRRWRRASRCRIARK